MIALPDRKVENANKVFVAFIRDCQSKPVRDIMAFAEQEIILPMDGGPHEGEPFRGDFQPYVKLLYGEIKNGPWNVIIIAGPSQSGKTLCAFVIVLLYVVLELQRNMVVGIPDETMIGDKWKVDIEPVFRATPKLEQLLPRSGPGSKGGTIKTSVQLSNGRVIRFMTVKGSDQSKAGFTSPIVAMTEAAGWSRGTETSKESNPLRQVEGRQKSKSQFDDEGNVSTDRRLFVEGTLTDEFDLPYSAKEGSTESELVCQCVNPKCRKWVCPEREHLKGWLESKDVLEAAANGRFHCPECDYAYDENERKKMVRGVKLLHKGQSIDKRGRIQGDPPKTLKLWFRWSAFHNLFLKTADFAVEEWEASRIEEGTPERDDSEKQLCQQTWAIPHSPPLIDNAPLSRRAIRKRTDQLSPGAVPANTEHFAFGIDPGRYQVWYFGLCARNDGRLHSPVHGAIDTTLTKGGQIEYRHEFLAIKSALLRLFEMIDQGWPMYGQTEARPGDVVMVDRGYFPDAVISACKEANAGLGQARRFYPILGRGKTQLDSRKYESPKRTTAIVRKIDKGGAWHLEYDRSKASWQIVLNADQSKLDIQSCLRVPKGHVGALTLPSGPERDKITVSRHLASEVFRRWIEDGQVKEEWIKRGQNHLLDAAGYAWVGLKYLGWRLPENQADNEPAPEHQSNPSWLDRRRQAMEAGA